MKMVDSVILQYTAVLVSGPSVKFSNKLDRILRSSVHIISRDEAEKN